MTRPLPVRIAAIATASGLVMLGVTASPAQASGGEIGGAGAGYYLSDTFSGKATTEYSYGGAYDQIYVGDWDGNGTDTLAVRRGTTFHFRNTHTSGPADIVVEYGNIGDVVIVGDWNGDGTDTLAVRRGNQYHIKNSISSGIADAVVHYGDTDDTVLVGDWDGNRTDTLAVRRDATYYLKNSISSGTADAVIPYGDTTDTTLVGDWNGDGTDTLGVRRTTIPGVAPDPAQTFGDGTFTLSQVAAGTYRAAGGASCYWERLSGFGGTMDDVIANDYSTIVPIVTIQPSDAGFSSDGCGSWRPVHHTYPSAPATTMGDGTYFVGRHIDVGTYLASGGADCYWERSVGFSGTGEDIVANDYGVTQPVVALSSFEPGFMTRGCGTWTKLN